MNPISDAPATTQTVAVTAQFMQSFEIESPVVAGSDFAAGISQTSSEQSELYFIGSAGTLFRVYPSPTSSTGWACDPISLPTEQLSCLSFAGAAPGRFTLVGVASNSPAVLVLEGSSVTASKVYEGNGTFSDIRSLSLHSAYPGMTMAFSIARISGSTETFLVDPMMQLSPVQLTQDTNYLVYDFCAAVLPAEFGTTIENGSYQSAVSYHVSTSDEIVQGAFYPGKTPLPVVGDQYRLPNAASISQFSSVWTSLTSGALVGLTLSGTEIVQYIFSQSQNSYSMPTIYSGDITLTSICLCGAASALELYAISQDNVVYHMRESAGSWSALEPVASSEAFVGMRVVTTGSGQTQAFLVTQTSELFLLMQNAASGDWSLTEIEFEPPQATASASQLASTTIYSTQIMVTNSDGTPYGLQTAQLTADDSATLQVNGQFVYVDPTTDYSPTTDIQGRIQIWQTVDGLDSPVLSLTFPFMSPGAAIVMDPSATIQTTLSTVTAADLQNPNNCTIDNYGTTGPLLPTGTSQSDVDQAVQAINAAANMILPWSALTPASPQGFSFARRTDARVASYVEGIDPATFALPQSRIRGNSRWSIERDNNGMRFLTGDAVTVEDQSPVGLFGISISWGDLVDLVTDAIWTAAKIVVDGTNAVIQLVINGATKVYNAVIQTASQVFDLIGMVFDWIGVAFAKVAQFLSFIFNFNDIKAIASLIQTAVNGVMGFVPLALQALQLQASKYSASLQADVTQAFGQAIAKLNANQTMASEYAQGQGTPNTGSDTAMFADDHSIARVGFANNVTASTSTMANVPPTQNISNLNTGLGDFFAGLSATKGYTNWTGSATNWTTPGDVTNSALSGLLQLGEAFTLAAIDGLENLINLLLQGIADCFTAVSANFLNGAWNIPFVSELYQTVTGSELTTLGLASLLISMPLTMTLKFVTPQAIPSAAMLEEFAAYCTPANLMDVVGLNGAEGLARAALKLKRPTGDAPVWQDAVGYIFGYANGLTSLVMGFLEPLLDLYINPLVTSKLTQQGTQRILGFSDGFGAGIPEWMNKLNPVFYVSVAALTLSITDTILGCPFLTQTGVLPLQWNAMGFLTGLWGWQSLALGLDMVSMFVNGVSARVADDLFPALLGVAGFLQLGGSIFMYIHFSEDDNQPPFNEFLQMYVDCIPLIDKFLHMNTAIEATEGISYVILPFIDQAANFMSAFLSCANSYLANPYTQQPRALAATTA